MRFVIPKGVAFYCEFEVKEPGSSTPMDLTGATGTFTLSTIGPNVSLVLSDVPLVVQDADNGVISVSLTADQTEDLVSRRGFAEDGYPIVPTYKAQLDIQAEDPISVSIPQVYINDSGA